MRRRSRAGSLVKVRRRKSATPRRPNASKSARSRTSSVDDLKSTVARLTRELGEALDQRTATAEVLRVISTSPGDLEPVFQAMLANAARICEAKFGSLYLYDGDRFRVGALHNAPAAFAEFRRREPVFHPPPGTGLAQIVATKRTFHTPDIRLEKGYVDRNPIVVAGAELGGFRTVLTVPMLKDDNLIGCINIYRQEVRPFTDKQIELVTNFAAQAVIAIENVRLLNELRQRTDDLTETLDQQTATSEVLRIISSSPGELRPVFQAMLENATRICGAEFGMLWLIEGDGFRPVALHGVPPALAEMRQREKVFYVDLETPLARLAQTKQLKHIADATREPAYIKGLQPFKEFVDDFGARTFVMVPMLKDTALLGAMAIYRKEVRPFTDKQIELVKNFGAQAVIAIENTRLLNELGQRTAHLSESLEQQTATSEVLRVISNSLSDIQPVFESIVQSGVKLFSGATVSIALVDNGMVRAAAVADCDPARAHAWRGVFPFPLAREYMHSRAILDREVVDIPDVERAPADLAVGAKNFLRSGQRAVTVVPLMQGDRAIGALSVIRAAPGPLSDKQLATLKTYADQAIIAIENTRLLNELRQSLERQTATSEVLRVISSSPGELKPVFDAILENATRICQAGFGTLHLAEGNVYRNIATYNVPPAYAEVRQREPLVSMTGNSALARVAKTKSAVQIADVAADPAYREDPRRQKFVTLTGARTLISVPMLKDDTLIGAITVYRLEVQPFTDKQIELVQNFAAQAIIAIENARLLNELRQRTEDLSALLNTRLSRAWQQ
jgi:GAF domain-containing protein